MKLRSYQREDTDAIVAAKLRAVLASEPGTGKTVIAVTALRELADSTPALVVAPASVLDTWRATFRSNWRKVRLTIIRGESQAIERSDVYLISWALLSVWATRLGRLGLHSIVADEAHAARKESAQRTRALRELGRQVGHQVLAITGTPVIEADDLAALGKLSGGKKAPLIIRRLKADVAPELPPKTRTPLYVDLRPKDRAKYTSAEEDFESWLLEHKSAILGRDRAHRAVARAMRAEAFTRIGYLRQLVGLGKVWAIADWIERAVRVGEPVVVFLEHQEVVRRVCLVLERQRIRYVLLNGSAKDRESAVRLFQANAVGVFLGTQAAKEGITLHAARNVLQGERWWLSTDEEQAEDRIHRIGQAHPTTAWRMIAVDTVDERVEELVQARREMIAGQLRCAAVDELAVAEDLLASWTPRPKGQRAAEALGLAPLGRPLPAPDRVVWARFGPRWSPSAARAYAGMHGWRLPIRKEEFLCRAAGSVRGSVTICEDVVVGIQ